MAAVVTVANARCTRPSVPNVASRQKYLSNLAVTVRSTARTASAARAAVAVVAPAAAPAVAVVTVVAAAPAAVARIVVGATNHPTCSEY